jgi:hypothetical protein
MQPFSFIMAISTTEDTIMKLVTYFQANQAKTRLTMVTKTTVKMNKKDVATKSVANPFKEIFKIQAVVVDVNADYEDKVNDQRVAEGEMPDFEKQNMVWGSHVGNSAIIENNGQLYLQTIEVSKLGDVQYIDGNGKVIEYSAIKPFIPNYTKPVSQGLDNEVKVRSFKLTSIVEAVIKTKNGIIELVV